MRGTKQLFRQKDKGHSELQPEILKRPQSTTSQIRLQIADPYIFCSSTFAFTLKSICIIGVVDL